MIRPRLAGLAAAAVSACATPPAPVRPPPEPIAPPALEPAIISQSAGDAGDPVAVAVAPAPDPGLLVPVSDQFTPDADLALCPRFNVINAPPANEARDVVPYTPFVLVQARVPLAVSPTNGACLSSGFGPRRGRLHKGLDLHARPAGTVHAAGGGTVARANFRSDYGHQVVIDHGHGVYTRYAHLKRLEPGVILGADVAFGDPLGPMGNSGAPSAVHLHYEILLGDIETGKGSFGLKPADPFSFPFLATPDEADAPPLKAAS